MVWQVFSFKLRGAYNKMANLTPEQREQGVITSSAGNHAQGVSLAASRLVRLCVLTHAGALCAMSFRSREDVQDWNTVPQGLPYSCLAELSKNFSWSRSCNDCMGSAVWRACPYTP